MVASNMKKKYSDTGTFKRNLRIAYPAGKGRMVLRTEDDWDKEIEPVSVSADGTITTFSVETKQSFLYFKPCLITADGKSHWAVGSNELLLMEEEDTRIEYPFFFGTAKGGYSKLYELPSKILGRTHHLRAYLPPGYAENTLATYPVAFMQDGQNLFFPEEAFMGQTWDADETMWQLEAMNAAEEFIIVGLRSADRMKEYTAPGYEEYARSLAEEVVPEAQRLLRVMDDRRFRSVWGSSLGGVVSFYTVWQYPEVFGVAVCMSSTFAHNDNLIQRVLNEPRPDVGFYLDSGWPGDNYEVTMSMAMALATRGWRYGLNFLHLCFPMAEHDEKSWGMRLHLPMQFILGAVARASRLKNPVLKEHSLKAGTTAPSKAVTIKSKKRKS